MKKFLIDDKLIKCFGCKRCKQIGTLYIGNKYLCFDSINKAVNQEVNVKILLKDIKDVKKGIHKIRKRYIRILLKNDQEIKFTFGKNATEAFQCIKDVIK